MKNWDNYLDENRFVIQSNGDGGDSLNRTCATYILQELTGQNILLQFPGKHIALLGNGKGKYRRNTHAEKWYSAWNRTSRDQLTPLVIFCSIYGYKRKLWQIFADHCKRLLLFTYNTRKNFVYATLETHNRLSTPDVPWNYKWKLPDLTGPEFWALYVRGFRIWWLWPLLCILDIETLITSIVLRQQPRKNDVINHALVLEHGTLVLNTPTMALARALNSREFLQKKLDDFFGRPEEPPINVLYSMLK